MKSCALLNEIIHAYDSEILLQLTGEFGRVVIPHLMKNAIAPSLQENIKGLKNKIVHDYENIDLSVLWGTIIQSLPMLKGQIEKVIETQAESFRILDDVDSVKYFIFMRNYVSNNYYQQ